MNDEALSLGPAVALPSAAAARGASRPLDLTRAGAWFVVLFLVSIVAFWPSYLSQPLVHGAYTQIHVASAASWMLLLIVQPVAIRTGRRGLHRLLGRVSLAVAPLVLVSVVLLAHSRIRGLEGDAYAVQTYVLYLQVSLAVLFGTAYALAMATRRTTALHARFMVCTGLTLIDPIVIRMMFWLNPAASWNYQWFTFALTDLILAALIWRERHSPAASRRVFPAMLALFVVAQAPAVLELTSSAPWQAFARWFAALPLTG